MYFQFLLSNNDALDKIDWKTCLVLVFMIIVLDIIFFIVIDLLLANYFIVWKNFNYMTIYIFYYVKCFSILQKQQEMNKNKEIIVLDHKRSNAINIGMTKLPPPRSIKTAILKMDATIMNREGIEVRNASTDCLHGEWRMIIIIYQLVI